MHGRLGGDVNQDGVTVLVVYTIRFFFLFLFDRVAHADTNAIMIIGTGQFATIMLGSKKNEEVEI